ncbi:hypothetical protein GQ53DRAFT_854621, partial [Thozetella sp. PMI_491]
ASLGDGTVSIVLLRSVLFIASIHGNLGTLLRLGYKNRFEAEDDLFNKATAAFDSDQETDRLAMLLCSYLLHYWSGAPSKTKDSLWWLAGAIRSAQAMGMHRTVRKSKSHVALGSLWRRTWWLLYIRDRQISLSLGKPMLINDHDCDVEFPVAEDFSDETPGTALYVIAQARLSISASTIYRRYLSPSGTLSPESDSTVFGGMCSMFAEWYKELPWEMQCDGPPNHQLALILNMTYQYVLPLTSKLANLISAGSSYYRIIMHQALQRHIQELSPALLQASNGVIMDAAEIITNLTEDCVTHSDARLYPMICVSAIFAAMTAQYTQSRSSNLSAEQRNTLLQSVKYKLLALKDFESCHVLANWIRQLFMSALHDQRRYQSQAGTVASQTRRSMAVNSASSINSVDPVARQSPTMPAPIARTLPDSVSGSQASNIHWDAWPLTEELGYPDMDLVNIANFDTYRQLPFPWSGSFSSFAPP